MSSHVSYQRVREQLSRLQMESALICLDEVLENGQRQEKVAVEILDVLLERELTARFERRVRTNFRLAGLPLLKHLSDFDFEAQPQVSKPLMQELATLRFLHQGENLLFVGPCGVGKTHLALALAVRALEEGFRVSFYTLHELVTKARVARERNRLHTLLNVIHRADLFVLDELGFLPLEAADATFLFEVVNVRYQKQKSTIITSNKVFSQWQEIFPDSMMVVALLDRLLHHAQTIQIKGDSYRLRHRRQAGLSPTTEEKSNRNVTIAKGR